MPRIFLSPPHMGPAERTLLLEAFDSNWIAPLGPQVDAFERELGDYLGGGHALAVSSGTAALHLALKVLGVSPGDEVVVPSLTFTASANPVTYLGAQPVFLDSEPRTWNMDPGLLEEELADAARRGKLPRAVVAVDLYGQCADYDALRPLCARYDVPLVEDAAEALGATHGSRKAGTLGHLGVFSFNGNKIITTSGGGMLVSERKPWIDHARFLSAQARAPAAHFEHPEVGFNYRMSNLLAAVGRGQLSVLEARIAARRRIRALYRRALGDVPGVSFQPEPGASASNCWLTCIQLDEEVFGASAETVRRALEAEDIESRPAWKPLHLQPAFAGCRMRGGAVCERLFQRGLCLPSGSALTDAELERIVEHLLACRRQETRR